MKSFPKHRRLPAILLALAAAGLGAAEAVVATCGPFTDTAADAFCPFVLEIFYLGITTGTTPTTYSPADNVTRLQMAAFLSRTVDGTLKRRGKRAALRQYWTTQNSTVLGLTTVAQSPRFVRYDGADLWVSCSNGISRVRASDGRPLETWTGAPNAAGVLTAIGKVLIAGGGNPGSLYVIDPSQPAGAATTVASNLGNVAIGIAFDGTRVFTANTSGSVSLVTPGASIPWTVTTVSSGFITPTGAVFDGSNVWITDSDAGTLLKLDPSGTVLQTVTVGSNPNFPVFDGTSLWVPNATGSTVSVVRASNGAVLATLTGNGLALPRAAAFDGQRVLVTDSGSDAVSLWKAADLTPLSTIPTGASTSVYAAASDGVSFWITLSNVNKLARF
ncbi:MAG TPA: S-layer homology domain-containing protein [Thermoanaerobaculia bacterium]|nr:S-layer homology domain-containing protein [Thermoanaerobaculia bacterium]